MRNLNDKYRTAMEALKLIADGGRKAFQSIKQPESKSMSSRFLKLTREEILSVFKEIRRFHKDQIIFSEGDDADGAYYLLEGNVKAVTLSPHQEEILLGELGRDEVFGEMALIDEKPRSATIWTITPCRTAFVSRNDFNEFIGSRSGLSFRFMAHICLSLFWRILRLDKSYAEIKKAFE
jgi:CRP-like cAMP-binding protein